VSEAVPARTGGCLCGAVRYEVRGALRPIVMCHCSQCRRMTGHVMAATGARHADFRLLSEDRLGWYASSGLQIACHIFTADKGGYYEIADSAPQVRDGSFSVSWQ